MRPKNTILLSTACALLVMGCVYPSARAQATPVAGQEAEQRIVDPLVSTVHALVQKAESASLNDRCYLYAKAVRLTTDLADAQVASGNSQAATLALASLQAYTVALETALTEKDKKLKDAEILLRESSFRLNSAMLAASLEDRPAMAAALAHVNAAEVRVMGAVFAR
jgi:hypothetical protein